MKCIRCHFCKLNISLEDYIGYWYHMIKCHYKSLTECPCCVDENINSIAELNHHLKTKHCSDIYVITRDITTKIFIQDCLYNYLWSPGMTYNKDVCGSCFQEGIYCNCFVPVEGPGVVFYINSKSKSKSKVNTTTNCDDCFFETSKSFNFCDIDISTEDVHTVSCDLNPNIHKLCENNATTIIYEKKRNTVYKNIKKGTYVYTFTIIFTINITKDKEIVFCIKEECMSTKFLAAVYLSLINTPKNFWLNKKHVPQERVNIYKKLESVIRI